MMRYKWMGMGLLSMGLLGACEANNNTHELIDEPQDLMDTTERELDSIYETDTVRVYLNSEEYDLDHTSTLRIVIENNSDTQIVVSDLVTLYHDGESLGDITLDKPVLVDDGVSAYISIDLTSWTMQPDELYGLQLLVDDRPARLVFYTGTLADALQDEPILDDVTDDA